jgi:hypothetical protein
MTPDAAWPNLSPYGPFTAADHAAHTSPKGTASPEDLFPGGSGKKMANQLGKFAAKPHLKFKAPKRAAPRRRKKRL